MHTHRTALAGLALALLSTCGGSSPTRATPPTTQAPVVVATPTPTPAPTPTPVPAATPTPEPTPRPAPPPASLTCANRNVPNRASCGRPTAGCNDGSWSCSQNRSGTCSTHGGVQCWVCPGPLC